MKALTLLIVDDEYWIRHKLIHQYDWARFGVSQIRQAANGEEAAALMRQEPVDVVLTDMDMPYMDGSALIQWIQANSPNTCVLVLSGFSDFPLVRGAMVGGALDYLLKPVQEDQLYSAMQRILEHMQAQPPSGEAKRALLWSPLDEPREEPALMDDVQAYVDIHYAQPLTLTSLAELFHVSPSHLSRSFKKKTKKTLISYITDRRMEAASRLLAEGGKAVTAVALQVGYDDYSYFSNVFRRHFGTSPRAYRKDATQAQETP